MNTISIYLKPDGSVAEVKKDFAMFVNSYQNKLIDVYVPKSILYENQLGEYTFSNAVKIGALITAPNGEQITTESYYLDYLKEVSIFNPITNQNVDYTVFEAHLPKEFTVFAGTIQIVINVVSINNSDEKVLQVLTSGVCDLLVQNSAYIGDQEIESTSVIEYLVGLITELQGDVNYIVNNFASGENPIGRITGSVLPENEEPPFETLNNYVEEITGQEPEKGDVVIFVLEIAGETDKNYKYFYTASGWKGYEIPPIEVASNGTLGLIQGTFNLGENTNNTLVDIQNGQIVNIYVLNDSNNYVNVRDVLNTNSTDIQNILNNYAPKQYVLDYSQPKEFNNVFYIDSTGYSDTVPTTPESGVQFTKQVNAIGDFQIFQISNDLEPGISFNQKNTYKSNIYVSSSVDFSAIFRLTTEIVRNGGNIVLETTLTDLKQLVAGNVYNLAFDSVMSGLELQNVEIQPNDKIQQTLDIITQESTQTTISVYSNDIYPSFLQFNTQSVEIITASGNLGEQPVIEANGVLNGNVMTFTLPNNTTLYNKTECLFKLTYNSTNITDDIEVVLSLNGQNIRLATPYNMVSGNATIGTLNQVPNVVSGSNIILRVKGFVEIDNNSNITIFVNEDNLNLAIAERVSNPNLLINGDFRINQRGLKTYTEHNKYTVDRWNLNYGSLTVNDDGSITHTASNSWQGIRQYIEFPSRLAGKTVTFSMKSNSSGIRLVQLSYLKKGNTVTDKIASKQENDISAEILTFSAKIPTDITDEDKLFILLYTPQANQSITYYWTKLEVGSTPTEFIPRLYGEELALCKRYYQTILAREISGAVAGSPQTTSTLVYATIKYEVEMRTIGTRIQKTPLTIACQTSTGGQSFTQTEVGLYFSYVSTKGGWYGFKNWTGLPPAVPFFVGAGETMGVDTVCLEIDAEMY